MPVTMADSVASLGPHVAVLGLPVDPVFVASRFVDGLVDGVGGSQSREHHVLRHPKLEDAGVDLVPRPAGVRGSGRLEACRDGGFAGRCDGARTS